MDNIKVNRFNQLPLIKLEENKLFLLDQNKNDKDNLETFITKSISHFKKPETIDELYVGFIYNQCDTITLEQLQEPIYTSITCLDGDDSNVLLITEIDKCKYNYKNFTSDDYIHLIRFKRNIQVQMPYYSHIILGSASRHIHIYLYNKKPDAELYVSENKSNCIESYDYENLTENKLLYDNVNLNFIFFNELLYFRRNTFEFITYIMECNPDNDSLITVRSNAIIDVNPKNLLSDIDNMQDITANYNRFINRHILTGILDPDICEYILLYSKKYLDDIAKISNPKGKNYLDLSIIPDLKEVALFYVHRKLMNKVYELYNIPHGEYFINPKFITITTTSSDALERANRIAPISAFTIDIMLSHDKCKSHHFNDSTYTSLSIGDAVIYNNSILKEYSNSNKDDIFFLTVFVEIISMQRLINTLY